MSKIFNHWITCPAPNPAARLRLFCLPFAGGGASVFRTWARALPRFIEVCPVQLPGRENRYGEPPYTDILRLADALAGQMEPFLQKPFALYGHSMGALLSFELARTLQRQGAPRPLTLFLAAHRAPHLSPRRAPIYALPDEELVHALRRLGGLQELVAEDRELLDVFLPTLRADLTSCGLYGYSPDAPLDCPLHLYAGRNDAEVPPEDMEPWSEHSTKSSSLRIFPGGHFFLRSDAEALMQAIAGALAQLGPH